MSNPGGGNGGNGGTGGVTPTPSGPIGNHLPRLIGSIAPPRPTMKGPRVNKGKGKPASKPASKPKPKGTPKKGK